MAALDTNQLLPDRKCTFPPRQEEGGGRRLRTQPPLRPTTEEEEEEEEEEREGERGLFALGRCASMGKGGGGKGKGPSRFCNRVVHLQGVSICSISSFRHEREMIDESAGWYSSPKRRREGKAAAVTAAAA